MHRKSLLIAVVGLLVLATLIIVAQRVTPSTASEQCVLGQLNGLPQDEQERCIAEVFGGPQGYVGTVESVRLATKQALQPESFPTRVWPTPTLTPIGYIDPRANLIKPLSNDGQDWRGTESIWIVGTIQNAEGMHFSFYVWTAEVRCRIGTDTDAYDFDGPFPADIPIKEYWDCPSGGSILTITNVTSPTGSVAFSTDQGQTGTFDLATAAWTLDGAPWVAPAPARAADPYPDPYPYPSP